MVLFESWILLIWAVTCPLTRATSGGCVDAVTSEGLRTLRHSQGACAPLQPGETRRDEGLRYLRCYLGKVYTMMCPDNTRYDVGADSCTDPNLASCDVTDRDGARKNRRKRSSYHEHCTKENCELPNCFCSGDTPDIPLSDTPMFVMITFDDAVYNDLYKKFFRPLFVANQYNLSNPSGCPVKMALYVSLQYSNITLVQEAYHAGNEIGSHTLYHELPEGDNLTYATVAEAIVGVKQRILEATGDRDLYDSIVGFRTPYLRCVGDVRNDVLRDHGFLYDSSLSNKENFYGRAPFWPYTFNYVPKRCYNCHCPSKRYAGLWQVPLNAWLGDDGKVCTMVDGWTFDKDETFLANRSVEQWYNYYHRHFLNYFYPYKVPMSFFAHGSMFYRSPNSYVALRLWLKGLLRLYPNVWVVPPKMVIQWMKRPLTHDQMKKDKWDCYV